MFEYIERMPTDSTSEHILKRMLIAKFDEILSLISELPQDLVNNKLSVQGSNSPAQILVHCCGMMRRWSSSVNLGLPVPRNRDKEFTIVLPKDELLSLARSTRERFTEDLAHTQMQAAPAALPSGRESEVWLATCQGVLFHVYEELCQHLGHLEITRDLLTAKL